MRRLPVYLLLDTSGSMTGEPIKAVKEGVDTLVAALRQDPYALETAYLSVITFDSRVKQVVPMTELAFFQAPEITASGATALGGALSLLSIILDSELRQTTEDAKGDWKPMVFIMTDGAPTDDWRQGVADFKKKKVGVTVACAVGNRADTSILKEITNIVVSLEKANTASISAFFKWVSASISTGSQKVETHGDDEYNEAMDLPPPPPEIDLVK